MHELEVAAFGADPRPLVSDVDVVDVEREDLAGPPGPFVQQPPQAFLPQRDAVALPHALELRIGDRAGAVGALAPALEQQRLAEASDTAGVATCPP